MVTRDQFLRDCYSQKTAENLKNFDTNLSQSFGDSVVEGLAVGATSGGVVGYFGGSFLGDDIGGGVGAGVGATFGAMGGVQATAMWHFTFGAIIASSRRADVERAGPTSDQKKACELDAQNAGL